MNIKNNTFIITGGASGLGLATAQMIVDNGGNAVILDINEEAGKSAESDKILFVKTDVSNEEQVQNAIDLAIKTFGGLHGICNCAGIGPAQRVVGKNGVHSLDFFSKVVSINLIGTFNVIRLATNVMQNNLPYSGEIEGGFEGGERGIIINTASVAAFDGQIGQAAYAASKGGIVAMTLPIARELARMGIRVMTIAPGIFETPLLASLPQEAQDSLGKQVPFPPRLGRPSEYANLVKHIIENQMLNGEVIRLDGAIRMGAK
ncbi:MAG: 3-hydroxyacyl-CoA dehydrogenase [Arcicella sp.]|nr:3-hydroxyacyl-CoA dehydrogenase [Arcicella sp.]